MGREGNATHSVEQQEVCPAGGPADLLAAVLVDLVFAGAAEIDDHLAALILDGLTRQEVRVPRRCRTTANGPKLKSQNSASEVRISNFTFESGARR